MNTDMQQPKRVALFAAIGALIALLSYLLLPFVSVTVSAAATNSGSYGSSSSYTQSISLGAGIIALFASPISLEALFAVAILCIAALFMLREAPFGQGRIPATVQMRRGSYALIALGLISVVYQFLFISFANGQVNEALQNASIGSTTLYELLARSNTTIAITFGYAVGSWLYLLGMLAVAGCGWMLARTGQPVAAFLASQPAITRDVPPIMQPSQPLWQQPVTPSSFSQPLSQPAWQSPELMYGVQSQPVPQRQTQQFPQDVPQTPSYTQPLIHPWQQPPAANTNDPYPPQGSY